MSKNLYELIEVGKHTALSQGLAINAGSKHLVSREQTSAFPHKLLKIASMQNDSYDMFISANVTSSVMACTDDIIYTRTGQVGEVFRGYNGVIHNNSFRVELTDNVFDKNYLYTVLKTNFVKQQANKLCSSSMQPDLTHDSFGKIKIPYMKINLQKKLAKFIECIDKKIQNNNKVNDNLQQMAYDTYMHLFFGKKTNGKFNDIIVENSKSGIQVGEAKNANGSYPFFTSGDAILKWHEELIEGRNCFLNTGGNADVKFYVGKAAYSTDTWSITAKKDMSDYLFLLLKSIKPELNQKFFQGTGLKHLQKPLLKDRAIYIPSATEMGAFNKTIQPLFNLISSNTRENQNLIKLRDWLLPMLMNGQATIAD